MRLVKAAKAYPHEKFYSSSTDFKNIPVCFFFETPCIYFLTKLAQKYHE